MASSGATGTSEGRVRITADTRRVMERAAGGLATRSIALMDERLGWFRSLPADQRSWVTLVAQAGITGYISWLDNPGHRSRIVDEVFGAAPREMIRSVSLRQTVDLVRVAISVAEEHLPLLTDDPDERAALRESLLRYSREIAFAAATVYATVAERRSSWDARVEAAVVDGIVRGEDVQSLASRAAALDWDPGAPAQVIIGGAPLTDREQAIASIGRWARDHARTCMSAVHGDLLVVVLAGAAEPDPSIADLFGATAVVRGPTGIGLAGASRSAAEALSGYRVAQAWVAAPRLVDATALLVERVLGGDSAAAATLLRDIYSPLAANQSALLETLDAYIGHGGSLEPAARSLFIHPNTMRYRLRRVAEITGYDPWAPRDMQALAVGLIVGRLSAAPEPVVADHRTGGGSDAGGSDTVTDNDADADANAATG